MKNYKRSLMALLLVAALSLGLAACGSAPSGGGSSPGGKPVETAAPEYVYAAEYKQIMTDSKDYVSPRLYANGGYYATTWEKVGENIPEGVTPQYEGQYDVYRTFLYFMTGDGKLTKLDKYVPLEPAENTDEHKDFSSGSSLSGMAIADDGSIVTVEYIYSSWYEGDEGVARYSDEYYNNQKYEQRYYLRWLDADGAEKSIAEIQVNPEEFINAYSMQLDDKSNVVFSTGAGLRAIAPDGTESYHIDSDGYIDSVTRLPDGTLTALTWSDAEQKQLFLPIDSATGSFGQGIPAPTNSAYGAITGDGEYDLYYTSGVSFYGLKLDGSEPVKLLSWLDCDVNYNNLGTVFVTGDGVYTSFVSNWDQETETYDVEKVTVSKVPYDSVPHKQSISMAAMGLDYVVLNQIIDFNRSNDKYRIEVTDYSEYNRDMAAKEASAANSNPGLDKLNTEIMAGNCPDIFCLSGLNYTQLASKGLLEDLYPFIDADSEFSRDDFFQNVLSAMEVDGKLCTTVSNYYINTVIGAASKVGDKPGWNYEQFEAALASMPEGCEAFDYYVTRNEILQNCMALDMGDFVDWSTGECHFDSQQFIDLLSFANKFPAEFDWDSFEYTEESDTAVRLAQGKQMLVQTSLYSIEDVLYNSKSYFQSLGGEITYIGYPTVNGTGNMLGMTDGGFAMSSRSEYKDACWDFLRVFFTDEYQKDNGWSLPSSKAVFEEKAKAAMTIDYQKDGDGNYLLDEDGEKLPIARYSIWNSNTQESEDVYCMTAQQVQQVRDLISTTTKIADYNSNIFKIVNDEVSAYFEGQKTAEDVAKLIQSKANIYVNEQR